MSQGSLADYYYLSAYLGSEISILGWQTFNRPADTNAYAAPTSTTLGDLIGNSTTAGSVVPMGFDLGAITGTDAIGEVAYLGFEIAGASSKSVRAHLFKGTDAQKPTFSGGDNAAVAISNYNRDRYLGQVDVSLQPGPGGSNGFADISRIPYRLDKSAGEKLWVVPECLTAFTPVSAGAVAAFLAARRRK